MSHKSKKTKLTKNEVESSQPSVFNFIKRPSKVEIQSKVFEIQDYNPLKRKRDSF